MYEVKVVVRDGNRLIPVTLATFDGEGAVPNYSYGQAIQFAKQIDAGFAVEVIYVPDEDNPEKAFGLIYARSAA